MSERINGPLTTDGRKPVGSVLESSETGVDPMSPQTQTDEIIAEAIKQKRPIIANLRAGRFEESSLTRPSE